MDTTTAMFVILASGLNALLGAAITAAITWSIVRAYYRLPANELRAEAARLEREAARLREEAAGLRRLTTVMARGLDERGLVAARFDEAGNLVDVGAPTRTAALRLAVDSLLAAVGSGAERGRRM